MVFPQQSCPKCGFEIGRILYCTPLKVDEYFCPNCGIKIQGKCSCCGTWLTVIEPICSKCGTKNTFAHNAAQ